MRNRNNIYLRCLMKVIVRQAKIIDPSSPHHLQQADIFIMDGFIRSIQPLITEEADREIKMDGLCISPGWVDIFSHFNDPGFEYRETIETGAISAAAGGFTDVLIVPNTSPVVHNKSAIEYINQKGSTTVITIHPIGAITKNNEGKELAEMYDMHSSGAVAFSDGLQSVQSAGLLLKALQYVKAIDATIIQVPDDKSFAVGGLMNEGVMATRLGLPGKPSIGEELIIIRDIELVKYTDSKLHITGITTAKSVQLIKEAKENGVKISCSVAPTHLFFTDDDLADYDTNLKVNPPLRTKEDRADLIRGILDGTIDCMASHHLPLSNDEKDVEFEQAGNGAISLQTAYAVVRTLLPQMDVEKLIALMSLNARQLFNLPHISIVENSPATFTLFLENEEWNVKGEELLSKSKNAPFIGKTLRGRPLGIINKDKVFLNEF
ncbi:MAG TPA: dihydroorotase [Chitinophagaceae bacterium]|nr:dihydroorotase [Chitinophagaceae bacterium]